ncbi:MAG: hypothetical protein AAFY50_03355 [Cyanobacteria bacterium J06648_1]
MNLKKIISALVAVVLIGITIYLGALSINDSNFVVPFGLACAIAAPTGLTLLGFVISGSNDEIVQQLAKVPEIEKLI